MIENLIGLLLVVGMVAGCGGPASSGDAGAGDLAMAGADLLGAGSDMAGGACNSLVNAASVVQQTMVAQPMPSPTMGGTIVPGTYYLTDSKIYQGAPPGTTALQLQATETVSTTTMDTVQYIVGASNSTFSTRSFSTSGTTLTVTFTCGGSGTAMLGYDATATQYTTYNNAAKTVNVWTKM